MKDIRQQWYDPVRKVNVILVDATSASQNLVSAHLSGPVSGYFLVKALCGASLLATELTEQDETLVLQMKCTGPLGGFNVECTAEGTLRGYTERKVLDDFDGVTEQPISKADFLAIVGERRLQVSRTKPGVIVSQGVSNSLDGYLAGSLQRKALIYTQASVSDEAKVNTARGILIECMPDCADTSVLAADPGDLSRSPRAILTDLGLKDAELKSSTPIKFACRCSAERAKETLRALPESERAALPEKIDITCHMCGRTFTVESR